MEEPQPKLISGDLLDELCHKLKHLCRSQDELRLYLVTDANDGDIKQAIQENESNIQIMRHKIDLLKADLPESDARKHMDLNEMQQVGTPVGLPKPTSHEESAKDGIYI